MAARSTWSRWGVRGWHACVLLITSFLLFIVSSSWPSGRHGCLQYVVEVGRPRVACVRAAHCFILTVYLLLRPGAQLAYLWEIVAQLGLSRAPPSSALIVVSVRTFLVTSHVLLVCHSTPQGCDSCRHLNTDFDIDELMEIIFPFGNCSSATLE